MATDNNNLAECWNESESKLVLPEQLSIDLLAELLKQNSWLTLPVKQVDFTHVIKADSAIFAVLLVWAANLDEKLQVIKLPEELTTLIKLYDLEDVVALV